MNYGRIIKRIFLVLFAFILPLVFIFILFIAVISPALWIGNMLGDDIADDEKYAYSGNGGNIQKDIDAYTYKNKRTIASDQIMSCTLDQENPDDGMFEKYHIIGSYTKSYRRQVIDDYSNRPTGEWYWENDPTIKTGACSAGINERCNIIVDDRYIDRFHRPSDGQIIHRYGFYSEGEGLSYVAGFKPYQVLNGNPVAFTDSSIIYHDSSKIVLEKDYGGNRYTFTYEGDFGVLRAKENGIPGDVLALSQGSEFTFTATINDEYYINPAVFYNTDVIMGEDLDGTIVPGQAEEGYRAYITTQVEADMDIWSKVDFKQPFDEVVITQCAEVIGVGDGGNMHTALDLISGTERGNLPLPSTISGTVVEVGYSSISGNFITIEHDETHIRVNYNHMQYRSSYNIGDKVNQGDILGNMGSTGLSTGVHLHMNVYQPMNADNTKYGWVNPMFLLTNYSYASGCPECAF